MNQDLNINTKITNAALTRLNKIEILTFKILEMSKNVFTQHSLQKKRQKFKTNSKSKRNRKMKNKNKKCN